jgi:hypothetical protein
LWQSQTEDLADIADVWIAGHTRSDTMAGVARDFLADAPVARRLAPGLD